MTTEVDLPLLLWTGETQGSAMSLPQLPSAAPVDLSGQVYWQVEARHAPSFDLLNNPYWDDFDAYSRTPMLLLAQ